MCILSERQAQPSWPNEQLRVANHWLGVSGDQTLGGTFTTGTVVLPRDINSLYLVSEVLSGFRDSMGPIPNTRGTVCKISLGNTKFREYHAESVYRQHLYSTLPTTTLNQIDFALVDSRGVRQNLEGSNFSFVVTFDASHLAM